MEFVIRKASDYKFEEVRTFNTVAELMAFADEVGAELVIGGETWDDDRKTIVIYDDYLE